MLVAAGADLNAADYDDRTPLHVAGDQGYQHIWMYLIEKGADQKKKDVWGNVPSLKSKGRDQ